MRPSNAEMVKVGSGTHIEGLDGLRALAFLIVLFGHCGISWIPNGFGVTIFFLLERISNYDSPPSGMVANRDNIGITLLHQTGIQDSTAAICRGSVRSHLGMGRDHALSCQLEGFSCYPVLPHELFPIAYQSRVACGPDSLMVAGRRRALLSPVPLAISRNVADEPQPGGAGGMLWWRVFGGLGMAHSAFLRPSRAVGARLHGHGYPT